MMLICGISDCCEDQPSKKCRKRNLSRGFGFFLILELLMVAPIVNSEKFRLHDLMDESEWQFYFRRSTMDSRDLPEYELVDLELKNKPEKRNLNLRVFDKTLQLDLKQNDVLVSPNLRVVATTVDDNYEEVMNGSDAKAKAECLFLHRDQDSVGAFSSCQGDGYVGFLLMPNETFEVQPLTRRLKRLMGDKGHFGNLDTIHFVKRVDTPEINLGDDFRTVESDNIFSTVLNFTPRARQPRSLNRLTIEMGVFFDEAAYRIFAPMFSNDDRQLTDMILAYMNAVQAIFYHPSLGISIDIAIVYMEVMRRQAPDMPTHSTYVGDLLNTFCTYQQRLNPPSDNHPGHWDMALYISGLDFYTYLDGHRSQAVHAKTLMRGVCSPARDCAIVQFGTKDTLGRPYPSTGFLSVYISAHEIGHNLGMEHDSEGNYCPSDGYIMATGRNSFGETTWSECSAKVARDLPSWATCLQDHPTNFPDRYNHRRFHETPGQVWTAKKQCELFLVESSATVTPSPDYNICHGLRCWSPHRKQYFFPGPAIEGTSCGMDAWCKGGYCVRKG